MRSSIQPQVTEVLIDWYSSETRYLLLPLSSTSNFFFSRRDGVRRGGGVVVVVVGAVLGRRPPPLQLVRRLRRHGQGQGAHRRRNSRAGRGIQVWFSGDCEAANAREGRGKEEMRLHSVAHLLAYVASKFYVAFCTRSYGRRDLQILC